jgi:hypothetical protein
MLAQQSFLYCMPEKHEYGSLSYAKVPSSTLGWDKLIFCCFRSVKREHNFLALLVTGLHVYLPGPSAATLW